MSMPAPWASSSTGYHTEHREKPSSRFTLSGALIELLQCLGKVLGSSDMPPKSLVRPCTGLARVFSRPARASACVGLSGPVIAALPGPCSLPGSLDWLACAKWQAACDFWHTGGMVILTTPYAERTAWGMIVMIIPCPCTGKAKSTAFFRVNTVDLPLTLFPRQPPDWLTVTVFFLWFTPSTCRQLHWEDVAAYGQAAEKLTPFFWG